MLVLCTPATTGQELDSHYFRYVPKVSAIALAGLIVSTLSDFLPGLTFIPGSLLPLSLQAAALLCMIASNSKTIHIGANIALWLTWIFFLVVNHVYA